MIGLRLRIPIACWRKGHARELLESEDLPPPATCYGALLSLVGEVDRERHRGCRVTPALLNEIERSVVLRTLWQIKKRNIPQGNSVNVGPDLQQLVVRSDLVIWCDSRDEVGGPPHLEARIEAALRDPSTVSRFGGWSLGESTHLVNDVWVLPGAKPPSPCRAFVLAPQGTLTLPVWVDHVGTTATRYAVGILEHRTDPPEVDRMPRILPPDPPAAPPGNRRRRRA